MSTSHMVMRIYDLSLDIQESALSNYCKITVSYIETILDGTVYTIGYYIATEQSMSTSIVPMDAQSNMHSNTTNNSDGTKFPTGWFFSYMDYDTTLATNVNLVTVS